MNCGWGYPLAAVSDSVPQQCPVKIGQDVCRRIIPLRHPLVRGELFLALVPPIENSGTSFSYSFTSALCHLAPLHKVFDPAVMVMDATLLFLSRISNEHGA